VGCQPQGSTSSTTANFPLHKLSSGRAVRINAFRILVWTTKYLGKEGLYYVMLHLVRLIITSMSALLSYDKLFPYIRFDLEINLVFVGLVHILMPKRGKSRSRKCSRAIVARQVCIGASSGSASPTTNRWLLCTPLVRTRTDLNTASWADWILKQNYPALVRTLFPLL
jgi:hypothetical protein